MQGIIGICGWSMYIVAAFLRILHIVILFDELKHPLLFCAAIVADLKFKPYGVTLTGKSEGLLYVITGA